MIRQLLLVLCVWGKDAVGTRGETGRLFFFCKVVLNFVVSPSLQIKKWENFGARSHGHSARSRGHAFFVIGPHESAPFIFIQRKSSTHSGSLECNSLPAQESTSCVWPCPLLLQVC